jgi:hypothetical protein
MDKICQYLSVERLATLYKVSIKERRYIESPVEFEYI